jgi:ketosteroid isomerase-like protein
MHLKIKLKEKMEMLRKFVTLLFTVAAISLSAANAQNTNQTDNRDADRTAILAEIGRITQAFIDGDIETIYQTHSEDWSGFLFDNEQTPVKGVNEYMKANGIAYPPPPDYKKPGPNPYPNLHYKIFNDSVTFVTTDVGVASFMLDYPRRDGKTFNRLRIMDVFVKRDGKWVQSASYTAADPTTKMEQMTRPATLNPQVRQQILEAREAVWRAWFSNDRARLEEMIPDEAIAINDAQPNWENRAAILDGAKRFADSGAKLTRLEFPRTEIQAYGNTLILFTQYSYETERNGQKIQHSGNGIETFVRRGQGYVNTGWILAEGK